MMPTFLIVDDCLSILESLRFLLEHRGYAVRTASGGQEAIALAAEHSFDGAIVDVQMPGADGFTVCRALQKQAAARGRPLAFWLITGGHTAGLAQRASEAGALAVFQKPFELADMFRRFDEHFGPAWALAPTARS